MAPEEVCVNEYLLGKTLVQEKIMDAVKKGKQSVVFWSWDTNEPLQWPAWQDTPKEATVALKYQWLPTVL